MTVATGTLNTGTGTTAVNVRPSAFTSVTPSGVVLWCTGRTTAGNAGGHCTGCYGAMDGTNEVFLAFALEDAAGTMNTNKYTHLTKAFGLLDPTAAVTLDDTATVALVSGGFDFTPDAGFSADFLVHYKLVGGDISNFYCDLLTVSSGTGNQSFTAMGFDPDAIEVIHTGRVGAVSTSGQNGHHFSIGYATTASNEAVAASFSQDAVNSSRGRNYTFDGEIAAGFSTSGNPPIDHLITVDTLPATGGVTLSVDQADGDYGSFSTAILLIGYGGGEWDAGVFDTFADTSNHSITTTGIDPAMVSFASACDENHTTDTPTSDPKLSLGVAVSATERGAAAMTEDNGGTSEIWIAQRTDGCYIRGDLADAEEAVMDFVSMDTGGFTVVMDDAEPSGADVGQVCYLVVGDAGAATGIPIFDHHYKQMRGQG